MEEKNIKEQNEKLASFLRSLPDGAVLYSPLLREVKKVETNASGLLMKKCSNPKDDTLYLFRGDARLANFEQGEPMLFPSRLCRSWDVLEFKDGDIVTMDIILNDGKKRAFIVKFKNLSIAPFFTVRYYFCMPVKSRTSFIDQEIILKPSYSQFQRVVFRFATAKECEKIKAKLELCK